jgi:hypothetical protein
VLAQVGFVQFERSPEAVASHPLTHIRYFVQVSVRKYLSFAKCDICASLSECARKADNEWSLEEAQRRKKAHVQLVLLQRTRLALRDELALRYPQSFLSIMIDGMDSKKTNIPKKGDMHPI